jgi:hypothetical protein
MRLPGFLLPLDIRFAVAKVLARQRLLQHGGESILQLRAHGWR